VVGSGITARGRRLLLVTTEQVRSTNGSKANSSSDTNILGRLLGLEGLDALLVLGHDLDTAADVGATVARLSRVAEETEVQGDLALLLTVGSKEVKLAAHRAGLDLVQRDGSETDGGIAPNVLLHDLDVEDTVFVGGALEDNGLVPGGVGTGILVGLGLLE
jgi:hypothetical protein